MIDLSRYDEAEVETWPNCATLPPGAFVRVEFPGEREPTAGSYRQLLEGLRSVAPFLLSGLVLGLFPVSVGLWFSFLVDYWELGGLMYAAGVVGAALLTGMVVGVVGCLCLRRIR